MKKFWIYIAIASLGQALAFYLLGTKLIWAAVCHVASVVVGIGICYHVIAAKTDDAHKLMPLAGFLLAVIPGAVLGLCAALLLGFSRPHIKNNDPLQFFSAPPLPIKPLEVDAGISFGPGGLFDVLRHSSDVNKRLTTVRATTRIQERQAIPLLQLAMRDPVDDVRLLAYSIKDKIENRINNEIRGYQEQLETENLGSARARLQSQLASAFWELVYLDLVEGDLRIYALEQCLTHAQTSLDTTPSNSVLMLVSRAHLARGNLDQAQDCLERLIELGAELGTVAPYLAEVAYAKADYAAVRRWVKQIPEHLAQREPLRSVYNTWREVA